MTESRYSFAFLFAGKVVIERKSVLLNGRESEQGRPNRNGVVREATAQLLKRLPRRVVQVPVGREADLWVNRNACRP